MPLGSVCFGYGVSACLSVCLPYYKRLCDSTAWFLKMRRERVVSNNQVEFSIAVGVRWWWSVNTPELSSVAFLK